MLRFRKHKEPKLDEKTASQMLDNILHVCEAEPSSVPLSVLTSYSNYRRERFLLQKALLAVILLFFCLAPLLFVTPDIQLRLKEDAAKGRPIYELEVHTFMPISRITASVGGRTVPVYETADRTYTIEPTANGAMTVTVTLGSRQYSTATCQVEGVDADAPVVVSDRQKDGQIYIYLSDPGSGVDYEGINAKAIDGKEVSPVFYNDEENYIVFDYPEKSLNIYIPDRAGNTLQLALTVK